MTKQPYGIDIPVLLIFFNRPGCLSQVFEKVKKARPSKLFLYQDGAREHNEKDIVGIEKCREIVKKIDWECQVYTKFQEKNFGCDPSGYMARKWAFEFVDKCIILEDDCVPSQSFFPFCKELLDRYENDERICLICGMNNVETVESPYSYLFSVSGAVCGVATWKRVMNACEEDYAFLNEGYDRERLTSWLEMRGMNPQPRFKTWEKNRDSGLAWHETIVGVEQYMNHQLNIVPTKNLIHNVGNSSEGGTHSTSSVDVIPKGLRRIFTMPAYEIEFPLKHPRYIIEDTVFLKQLYRVMGTGHPFVQFYRKIEKTFLILKYDGFSAMYDKIKRKINRK